MGDIDRKLKEENSNSQNYVMNIGLASPNKEDQNLLSDGSTNYLGQIAKRDQTGSWRTGPLILGPETCEKMAVQGMVINLVPYLTGKLHLPSSYSANLVTTYQGTSYMFTLLGGFIADAYAGRFRVITGASVLMFFGLLILTLSASLPPLKPKGCAGDTCQPQMGTPLIILYIALYLLALGTGGIKACASPFGADQFDPHDEKELKNLNGYFSWYFFTITCGGFFAVTVLVYIQIHVGRGWGYLIPTVVTLVVITGFVMGRKLYRYKKPKGSPLSLIAKVLVSAFNKRGLRLPDDPHELYELKKKDRPHDYICVKHSNQFRFLDKAAIIEDPNIRGSTSDWRLNTVTRVEETKMVIRLLPILITTSLFYTVYAQMTTFSVEQGHTMARKIGGFEFPAASMAAFLQGAILLTLFLWERAFVPLARKFTGNNKGVTSLQRVGIGLVISIITMILAALVEKERMRRVIAAEHRSYPNNNLQSLGSRSMSIFWLLPQYILVGSGEALTYAGQLDFFYNESPKAMRSMGAAMCVCTLSIGYYSSSLLVSVVNSITTHTHSNGTTAGTWLPDDINDGKLYNFYWLLAGASCLNFMLFQFCANWYKYKAEARLIEEHDKVDVSSIINHLEEDDREMYTRSKQVTNSSSAVKQAVTIINTGSQRTCQLEDLTHKQKLLYRMEMLTSGYSSSNPRAKSLDEVSPLRQYTAMSFGTPKLEQIHHPQQQ
ncbi:hypothetical protein R1sor_008372 [Riccia sorocarpa]|uniref:Uncharacterized protein n=1 Tax=Riccia sorocarpa TaxID=122646 RepID=A0ABD3HXC9_9MARC